MELNEERSTVGSIVFGSIVVILTQLVLTTVLMIFTNFGWTGTIKWSNNLYLITTYLAIVTGSLMAGLRSHQRGWMTGAGVGLVCSFFLMILAILLGETINWGIYSVKILISGFIGTFGGIIGVNLIGHK